MTTILIVDDDARFRALARAVLQADGFTVIGEASDGRTGLTALRDLNPDVVLVDIGLPDMEGFAFATTAGARARVVLTSSREASAYGPRLTRGPWVGFLPKDELSGDAIRTLADVR